MEGSERVFDFEWYVIILSLLAVAVLLFFVFVGLG
jgi:hypothetical protein